MRSDFELLDAWGAGDKRAAKELIARHVGAIVRFFRNKTGGEPVEDLVQDTFLACVGARERFRREASFRTFLFATARNVLFTHVRRRYQVEDAFDPEVRSIADLAPGPSTFVAAKHEQRLLLAALRALPIDYQIALELYHWEELTGPELAAVLGIGENALRSRLHRAKQALRRELERIAANPELLTSTLANLDEWAAGLRAVLGRSASTPTS